MGGGSRPLRDSHVLARLPVEQFWTRKSATEEDPQANRMCAAQNVQYDLSRRAIFKPLKVSDFC